MKTQYLYYEIYPSLCLCYFLLPIHEPNMVLCLSNSLYVHCYYEIMNNFFSLNWFLFQMHINAFMPHEMVTFEGISIIKERDTQLYFLGNDVHYNSNITNYMKKCIFLLTFVACHNLQFYPSVCYRRVIWPILPC